MNTSTLKQSINMAVIVAALGYFVDVYDLVLFGVVRVASLQDLGIAPERITDVGITLLNAQMWGMLLGGILWGILGDKKGRIQVLFGSILIYSLANIANAYVGHFSNPEQAYAILRFIAGVGLAGELGAGITLVSEVMDKKSRGYSTAIVASIGVSGAVFAVIVSRVTDWQTAYLVGGAMGLMLLVLRMRVFESGMFSTVKAKATVQRGNILMLFNNWERFSRYISCIVIGIPIWYMVAILAIFSPELGKALGSITPLSAGTAVLAVYAGMIFGDLGSGFLSQYIGSRKKVVLYFLTSSMVITCIYLLSTAMPAWWYYGLCFFLGIGAGYWAVFVTIGAEQFGTNIRATVTTTVPNFVRGSVVAITGSFALLKQTMSLPMAAGIVGVVCFALAFIALWRLHETYGKDLDYLEEELP